MNKKTILIVNGILKDTNFLVSFFIDEYNVYKAKSLDDAKKIIDEFEIDLILLDYAYLKDYFENAKNILNLINIKKIPILCTLYKRDDYFEACILEKGISECIKKPYNEKLVKAKVRKAIKSEIDKNKVNEIDKSRNIIIIAMSILAESRDRSTGEHIFNIQSITKIIANKYKEMYPFELTNKELEEIILFSPLHDIGKIPIPDSVLKKNGIFTTNDFSIMKKHTILGGEMLLKTQNTIASGDTLLRVAIEIATYHHEKYDGTGYPYGLKGDDIPISARIVALADVYEALISPRRYKKGMQHEDVMNIILKGDDRIKPTHFDPKVLNAFECARDEIKLLN